MRKIEIYLAGACACENDEGRGWREELIRDYRNSDYLKMINPLDYFRYSENWHKTNKQVKEYYLSRIRKCDVVLVNLNNSAYSCGTAQEVQYAIDHDIPVIGFGNDNVYTWIAEVDCQVVFDNKEEAVQYILEYYC